LASIQDLSVTITEGHSKILQSGPVNLETVSAETTELLNTIDNIRDELMAIKTTLLSIPTPSTSAAGQSSLLTGQASGSGRSNVRLPKVELPKFNGDIKGWPFFRDLFKVQVNDVSTLSGVEKLNYLRSCVSGTALSIIQGVPVSNDGYMTAWQLMTERYENKRESFVANMRKFMSQSVVKEESSSSLRSLLDTSKELIRSLETHQIQVQDRWSAILWFLIAEKLDGSSLRKWESLIENRNSNSG